MQLKQEPAAVVAAHVTRLLIAWTSGLEMWLMGTGRKDMSDWHVDVETLKLRSAKGLCA